MCMLESFDQTWRGSGEARQNLLIIGKQVRVLGLEGFDQSRDSIIPYADQFLRGAVPLRNVRELRDESFCFTLLGSQEPIHAAILL